MARVQYLNVTSDWIDTHYTGLSFPRQGFIQENVEDEVARKMAQNHPDVYRIVADDFVEEAPKKQAEQGADVPIDESIMVPDLEGGEVPLHEATVGMLTHYIQERWPHVNIADQSTASLKDMQVFVTQYSAMAPDAPEPKPEGEGEQGEGEPAPDGEGGPDGEGEQKPDEPGQE